MPSVVRFGPDGDGLLVFLYDGRVEIDSNFVENRICPLKLTAKNVLFAGYDEGAAGLPAEEACGASEARRLHRMVGRPRYACKIGSR